ncbi:ankyrin repeat domain-containing protein [Wolbachia endosymbiont of Trichogramma pretiosum]|uniref:ankyrin repeat domain-containing protein n=1 Tax=Wolbachia endosymbiont of Trichogramma pretiosum TaxID=125593 RepID=UPI0008397A88|nr:ankyrin repeat domain-containing protein [Wolbachia endosymbiont of Trichogramma pretiosum]OCA06905.1 ankyrin repeat family protein [Wolbachia endosymbiont of Trichogramma pretiosum]
MYQEEENSVGNSRFILPHIELSSRRKANINVVDRNGETPLHYAAKRNRLEQVKLLLKKGEDINISSNSCVTVLHLSFLKDYRKITRLLLGETESSSTGCSDANIEKVQTINQFYPW